MIQYNLWYLPLDDGKIGFLKKEDGWQLHHFEVSIFWTFFIFSGPRATRQKKLQNSDSRNQKHRKNNIISSHMDTSVLIIYCYQDYAFVTIPYVTKNSWEYVSWGRQGSCVKSSTSYFLSTAPLLHHFCIDSLSIRQSLIHEPSSLLSSSSSSSCSMSSTSWVSSFISSLSVSLLLIELLLCYCPLVLIKDNLECSDILLPVFHSDMDSIDSSVLHRLQ